MSFSVGIVGLPNVGKSTLFAALTKNQVEISNYPFCTINPNVGVVAVPDERLNKIKEIVKPERTFPTIIEFVDIAGLVRGAHQGEGLGNQFLAHIRETDAILHVVRLFEDKTIAHLPGMIKPVSDISTVNTELALADLATIEKHLAKVKAKTKDKKTLAELKVLEKLKITLEKGQTARKTQLSLEEKDLIKHLSLLTLKPVIYIANVSEDQLTESFPLLPVAPVIPVACKLEWEMEEFSEKEKNDYLTQLGLEESRLDTIIKECYKLLDLITFFTIVGGKEARAWTLKRGANILQAASQVHTDFQKKFKKAEIIHFADFIKAGSENKAQKLGLVKTEGKDYIVQDGDIIHFKI